MRDSTEHNSCATPLPKKRREWRDSFPNTTSSKKRRLSHSSPERPHNTLATSSAPQTGQGVTPRVCPSASSLVRRAEHPLVAQGDRYIPTRQPFSLPLYASPRTVRIANVFGLADGRILSYNDRALRTPENKMFQSLRSNVLQ